MSVGKLFKAFDSKLIMLGLYSRKSRKKKSKHNWWLSEWSGIIEMYWNLKKFIDCDECECLGKIRWWHPGWVLEWMMNVIGR